MMSATWQDLKFLAQLVQLNSRECMHVNMDLKVRNCRLKINEVIYIHEFSPLFLTGNMDKSIIQDLGTCLGIETLNIHIDNTMNSNLLFCVTRLSFFLPYCDFYFGVFLIEGKSFSFIRGYAFTCGQEK